MAGHVGRLTGDQIKEFINIAMAAKGAVNTAVPGECCTSVRTNGTFAFAEFRCANALG